MRILLIATIILFFNAANADQFNIPWKGDYPHNSSKLWSKDNPYDSGFSRNFLNGTPQEFGQVQKDGELIAEIIMPEHVDGPVPFMIVMHGCFGNSTLSIDWARHVAWRLKAQGVGTLILDSFTTRHVEKTCGMSDFHWGRRRADDAYSALDYLIEKKLAKPDEVYLTGQSNGGLATLISMSKEESDHKNKFAAGFPMVPSCISTPVKHGDYVRPMIIFVGEKDDANPPQYCVELLKKKRVAPIQLILYKDANHGFMVNYRERVEYGWTDTHGTVHNWHLSYNPIADKDMMDTIITAISTKKFVSGVEYK